MRATKSGKLAAVAAALSVFASAAFFVAADDATSRASAQAVAPTTPTPTPRKIEEFIGELDYEDLIARLDQFAVQIQSEPGAKGHVIVYRARRDPPGVGHSRALTAKSYLVHERGLDPLRIITTDGGMGGCLMYELWIVPAGAPSPERKFTYRHPQTDGREAYMFDSLGVTLPEADDDTDVYTNWEAADEFLDAFAAELKEHPKSRGQLVGYATYCKDCRFDERGAVVIRDSEQSIRNVLRAKKDYLVRAHRINASRIGTVFGGHRLGRGMDLWVVPPGAGAPVPTPTQYPPPVGRKR